MRPLDAVLSGSFRRDEAGLRAAAEELQIAGCRLLSPLSLDFVDFEDGFARTEAELVREPGELERAHLEAIRLADLLWIHLPQGRLGVSASAELGYATALEVPAFAAWAPADVGLADLVRVVSSPAAAVAELRL